MKIWHINKDYGEPRYVVAESIDHALQLYCNENLNYRKVFTVEVIRGEVILPPAPPKPLDPTAGPYR